MASQRPRASCGSNAPPSTSVINVAAEPFRPPGAGLCDDEKEVPCRAPLRPDENQRPRFPGLLTAPPVREAGEKSRGGLEEPAATGGGFPAGMINAGHTADGTDQDRPPSLPPAPVPVGPSPVTTQTPRPANAMSAAQSARSSSITGAEVGGPRAFPAPLGLEVGHRFEIVGDHAGTWENARSAVIREGSRGGYALLSKKKTKLTGVNSRYVTLDVVCQRSGVYNPAPRHAGPGKQRASCTKKIGCPYKINICWPLEAEKRGLGPYISKAVLVHSHPLPTARRKGPVDAGCIEEGGSKAERCARRKRRPRLGNDRVEVPQEGAFARQFAYILPGLKPVFDELCKYQASDVAVNAVKGMSGTAAMGYRCHVFADGEHESSKFLNDLKTGRRHVEIGEGHREGEDTAPGKVQRDRSVLTRCDVEGFLRLLVGETITAVYHVSSVTGKVGHGHVVVMGPDGFYLCSCLEIVSAGNLCRHILALLLDLRGRALVFNGAILHPRWRPKTAERPWLLERVSLKATKASPANVPVPSGDLVESRPSTIETENAPGDDDLPLSVPSRFDVDQVNRSHYEDWVSFGVWCGERMDDITTREASARMMDAMRMVFETMLEAAIVSQRQETGGGTAAVFQETPPRITVDDAIDGGSMIPLLVGVAEASADVGCGSSLSSLDGSESHGKECSPAKGRPFASAGGAMTPRVKRPRYSQFPAVAVDENAPTESETGVLGRPQEPARQPFAQSIDPKVWVKVEEPRPRSPPIGRKSSRIKDATEAGGNGHLGAAGTAAGV